MLKKSLLAGVMLAAFTGAAVADYQQGVIAYQEGRYTSAYIDFKASANVGDAASQYMLGRLYQEGRGVDRDLIQAYAWYDLAAVNGSRTAANARDSLAAQLSASQLQTATSLSAQWRSAEGSGTASPAPNPSAPPYSVRAVQQALATLGYSVGTIDGLMGPNTRGAIRAYQIDSGLPASGEPSVSLYAELQNSLQEQAGNSGSDQPSGPSPELISEVQAELRLRGYYIPAVNGQLNSATVAAIEQYQRDASLSVTGKVSDQLLTQLRSGREDPAAERRAQVQAVQSALNDRGYSAGPVDGALGPKTRGAIRAYEVAQGLPVDGEIDAELLASLGIEGDTASGGGGDTGSGGVSANVIASIEGELIDHNYAAGTVDGVIDNQARAAISAYQRDAGLNVTGGPSEALLDSLRNSDIRNRTDRVNYAVYRIEQDLQTAGYQVGPVDGTLDSQTSAGIEAFQRDAGLPVTGRPSEAVLAGLQDGGSNSGGQDLPANELTPEQTWELEKRLQTRGYNIGTLNNQADAQTHAAVRAYQRDQGLAVDGVLDQQLLTRLQQADAAHRSWQDLSDVEKGITIMKGVLDTVGPALQD